MAQITWRNVDSPNLNGVTDGIRTTANLFSNATDALSRGLAGFQDYQHERAAATAMGNALQFNDPAAYQAALANGSLMNGVDTSQLTARDLAALGARSGDLLQNAAQQQTLDYKNYNFDREKSQNANLDAASPFIAEANTAYAAGDKARGDALMAQHQDTIGKLTPDQITALNRSNVSLTGSNLSNIGQGISNNRAGFELGKDMTNYEVQNRANQLLQDMTSRTFSPDDKRAYIEQYAASPGADARVTALLRGNTPGLYNAGSGGTGTGAGVVFGNGKFGSPSVPIDQGTMGQAVDFGNKTLVPATKGQIGAGPNLGTSATGAFQITAGTYQDFAPKVFGDNWRDTPNTLENQTKLAEAIFNDRKGGDLTQTWTSLKNIPGADKPGAFKDIPFDQIKQVIAQGESGGQLPTQQRNDAMAGNAAQLETSLRLGQQSGGVVGSDMLKAIGQGDQSRAETVDKLLAGDLKGTSKQFLNNQLEDIMKQTGYNNYAMAGEILRNSLVGGDEGTLSHVGRQISTLWGGRGGPNLGNGQRLDTDKLEANINAVKGGNFVNQVLDNQQVGQQQQQNTQLQAQAQQAQQELTALMQRAQSQPQLAALIPQYQARAAQYRQLFMASLQQTQQNPANIPANYDPNGLVAQQRARQQQMEQEAQQRAQATKAKRSTPAVDFLDPKWRDEDMQRRAAYLPY